MLKKLIIVVICVLVAPSLVFAARPTLHKRGKNLHSMVQGKPLTVYLGKITSDSDKVSADHFRKFLKIYLESRKKETFIMTENKESADVIINATLISYQWLEKDPLDHLAGGWSGLALDAAIDQNYARIDADFEILRAKDNKVLWNRKFYSSVTETVMPEGDSIPKVLNATCRQFVFLCFGGPKR